MDQGTLVDEQIVDGRRFLQRFAADGHPISAAAWIKEDDDRGWYLYLVTELVNRGGALDAYHLAEVSKGKIGDPRVTTLPIRLISPAEKTAQGLVRMQELYPDALDRRTFYVKLGSMVFDETHQYSPRVFELSQPGAMTTEDIGLKVFRMLSQGSGLRQPARVTLKDGTGFDGVPFGLQAGSHDTLTVQFVAEREVAPRVYPINEIASIQ